ncbi:hypothetical protein [Actinocrispum wychmicini]|uniref:hypothetical protein n=1 Tax=Actinocrispum wychmicini TaxID=1213861 RepID=UPI0010511A6E|nr:hypothetical protein [Actinocrispum wychmicini]
MRAGGLDAFGDASLEQDPVDAEGDNDQRHSEKNVERAAEPGHHEPPLSAAAEVSAVAMRRAVSGVTNTMRGTQTETIPVPVPPTMSRTSPLPSGLWVTRHRVIVASRVVAVREQPALERA